MDDALHLSRPGSLDHRAHRPVRSSRFGIAAQPGVAWGTVEGAPEASVDALTVAAIEGHPFGPLAFTGDRWALADVRLLAPFLPSKVVAIGKNYAEHAARWATRCPTTPLIFLKPSTSVIGAGDAIRLPAVVGAGRLRGRARGGDRPPARDVPPERRPEPRVRLHRANDVTARDQQRADGQWTRAKGYDSFCPLGPWIETELDPSDLRDRHPGQRRGEAGRADQRDDPRHPRPDRVRLRDHDAAARRRDPDRHAGRRRPDRRRRHRRASRSRASAR